MFKKEIEPIFRAAAIEATREYWDHTSPGQREKVEALCENLHREEMAGFSDLKPSRDELPMPALAWAVSVTLGIAMGHTRILYDELLRSGGRQGR